MLQTRANGRMRVYDFRLDETENYKKSMRNFGHFSWLFVGIFDIATVVLCVGVFFSVLWHFECETIMDLYVSN